MPVSRETINSKIKEAFAKLKEKDLLQAVSYISITPGDYDPTSGTATDVEVVIPLDVAEDQFSSLELAANPVLSTKRRVIALVDDFGQTNPVESAVFEDADGTRWNISGISTDPIRVTHTFTLGKV